MTRNEFSRARESDLLNTASWIYASTGAPMDVCLEQAEEVLRDSQPVR